jgi:hypothetical protein
MNNGVPALHGATRLRSAPCIGLRGHRPWDKPSGNSPKRGALFLIALALTGCATTRYVTVSCVTRQQYSELQRAEPPKVGDKLTGQADSDIRIVAGSAIRLRAWGDGLLGVLEGCQEPPRAADGGGS